VIDLAQEQAAMHPVFRSQKDAGAEEIPLDLNLDNPSNVAPYPKFQTYFRTRQPPFLAVWRKHNTHFLLAGAEAYRRDLPDAEIHLLDTGKFGFEAHAPEIGELMRAFLARHGI
jgi:hypothetical protein